MPPGKSWKLKFKVLECPGKISLKITLFCWFCSNLHVIVDISVVNFEVSSCTKFQIFWGSTPDPAGGTYSAPLDPIAGGKGAHCPIPKRTPPPLSDLRLLFSLYLSIRGTQKRSWKSFSRGSWKILEKSWIFFSVKAWEPCIVHYTFTYLLKLCHFKSDQSEIWHNYFLTKYACTNVVGFLI